MGKREFVLLANVYEPKKHSVHEWFMSEKLDGMRAIWDGGITTGMSANEVPWANVTKHDRYINPPRASGLWTRYGQPIQAPSWFTDRLPRVPLDGELHCGRGQFQLAVSCIKKLSPVDSEWRKVTYSVFDSPPPCSLWADGKINNANFKKQLSGCFEWAMERGQYRWSFYYTKPTYFYTVAYDLPNMFHAIENVEWHRQTKLPIGEDQIKAAIDLSMAQTLELKGEGLMLRAPHSIWTPERTNLLLKVKPANDMEVTVVGYTWGKETDLEKSLTGNATNKLLGLMGSVRCRMDSGKEFDLHGFTDAERVMQYEGLIDLETKDEQARNRSLRESRAYHIGVLNPGQTIQQDIENPLFPRGSKITITYRELTNDGLPKEARYLRKRED
jgi:hypothetical protein